ncbi:TonB-dependent copper receptor [Lysobacter soyae]|uniref:TonB-dependent copper receptor n=1 Tax=Lysobacter soyae TaxID=2764185 RepID=A0ABX8WP38_9GAMM|nr:TonB-dependent copper receptor [Lysobacter sp. CJ11]QYR53015.1 TonB-dependent copper receptor [Lysobacter sp. CJ11]
MNTLNRAARARARLSLAVAMALATMPALAQQNPSDTEHVEAPAVTLEKVVVTAAPVSPLTFELETKLPRQPVPASDGADYLKTVPGFNAIRNGGTNGDPVLRGMHGSRLNILTDEGTMPGGCPARMDNPLSYVSPENFDRLIVVKGPQTVLWGPGASAGTIRFDRLGKRMTESPFEGGGSLMAGAFNRRDAAVDLRMGKPLVFLRTTANHSQADDYTDGNGDIVPSAWKKWNADVSLGYTPDDDTVIQLNAGSGDGEAKYAGRGMDGRQFKREHLSLQARTTGMQGVLAGYEASLYYNRADHIMDNYSLRTPNPKSMMAMPMYADVDRTTTGGRVALSWQLGRLSLATGGDFSRSEHRSRVGGPDTPPEQLPWVDDARLANSGLFVEATWKGANTAQIVFGARGDRATVQDLRAMTDGMMPRPNPTRGQTRQATLASGFLRIESNSSAALQWYAGLGHVERMPDYWELFSATLGPVGSVNAFSALRPEQTTQWDVGFAYQTRTVSLWANGYIGRIHDYIEFSDLPMGMMRSTRANKIDANIHGLEAGGSWRIASHWRTEGSVAYAWGEHSDSHTPLGQIPPLEARWTLAYETNRWGLSLLGRGVRGQDRIAPGQGNVVGRDIDASRGFSTWALNAHWQLSNALTLSGGIDNAFNRVYSEHLNRTGSVDFGYTADPVRINEPGRTVWIKLTWR